MGDPNHSRFDHTYQEIAQQRYCFVLKKFLPVQPHFTGTKPIPTFSNNQSLIRLTILGWQRVSLLLIHSQSSLELPNWTSWQQYILVAGDTS